MIGCVGGSRDRSCLCLIAIYAAHVALFHVFDVAPLIAGGSAVAAMRPLIKSNVSHVTALHQRHQHRVTSSSLRYNDTGSGDSDGYSSAQFEPGAAITANILDGQLRPSQVFSESSQFQWDSSTNHPMTSHPRFPLDFLFSLSFCHQVKNMFATVALSSSTWGIICGCAIFLLTYTDRDTLQT